MPPSVPWSRPEPFGAWVRLDDATLLAVDHDLAARLRVPHGAPAPCESPLELHLAVTARCPVGCAGCYVDARPEGAEPTFEELRARLAEAAAAGVSTVAFGGGEPLLRRDLGALADAARELGLVPVMTTSGLGLTPERAEGLRAFAQINVSHDGVGEGYAAVRGIGAAPLAERAIAILAAAGIPVGVNVVLTRASLDALPATAARTAALGAGEIQLLRYKPAGRAAGPAYAARRLLPAQVGALWSTIEALSRDGRLRVRIDCALVPLLSASLIRALPRPAEALAALGVFGCEAARHLGALTADGAPAPCSMFSAEPAAPSALRAYHAAPPEPCRSCPLRPVCRGGCQVVARHETGGFAPDPECPRVLFHAASPAPEAPGR